MSKPAPDKHAPNDAPPPSGGLVGRALGGLKRRPLLLLAGVAVLLLPGVIGAYVSYQARTPPPRKEKLATAARALAALDEGDQDEAWGLAGKLIRAGGGDVTVGHMIRGHVASQKADEEIGTDTQETYRLVAEQFAAAAAAGEFPEERRDEAVYRWGRALARSGQPAEALGVLAPALAEIESQNETGERGQAIRRILWPAALALDPPDYAKAVGYLTRMLSAGELTAEEERTVHLERARALVLAGKLEEAAGAIEGFPQDALATREAALLGVRVRIAQAILARAADPAASAGVFAECQPKLKELQSRRTSDVGREAMYLLGVCQRETGESRAAADQFRRLRSKYEGSPESIVAALDEAELRRELGDPAAALAAYRFCLEQAGPGASFRNPWITLSEARRRVFVAWQRALNESRFAEAAELASLLAPLFAEDQALERQAETHRAWARHLVEQIETGPAGAADSLRTESLAHFCTAGEAFHKLAQRRYAERDYPDRLWAAAENYLDGRDYAAAVEHLREYLRQEARRRRAAALAGLGRALFGMGQSDAAIEVLKECIELHPQDPVTFQARVVVAEAYLAIGAAEPAEQMLLTNLEGEFLTPASREWRASLFLLGKLMYLSGKYEEAILRLEEAVERYPEDHAAVEARYLVGQAFNEQAAGPRKRLAAATSEATRIEAARDLSKYLTAALAAYDDALTHLGARDSADFAATEAAVLRNCYFAKGAVLFEMGQYEQALDTYTAATNRYQRTPAALEALVRAADCHLRLEQPQDYRAALQRARVMLKQIPEDAPFTATTNFTRQEWSELIDQLAAR